MKKNPAEDAETAAGTEVPGQSRQTVITGNKNDGGIVVSFSGNDLEARADFIPPSGRGMPLTQEQAAMALEKLNIIYGIRHDAIGEAILKCGLDRRPVKDVLIAKGDAPVNEVTEYYEMNPHLTETSRRQPDEKARVDHRAYSPFIIVKKDQALAKLRFHKQGKEGKNVHGVPLPFEVIRPEGVIAGENTRIDGRLILATINGQLVVEKKVLSVRNSLVIKGPVGYGTGNIIFPGDVVIEGPVSDGFRIYSGGSVTIKQTFDVTDVITKGDLVVIGGIIGKRPALVKSGGAVKTKFIENCRVAARKTITVDAEIINSSVFTLENIDLGEKGLILGGDIYAVRGIKAGGIGRKAGKATRIHCGIDFTAQQEKEKNNNQLRILAAKLEKLRELHDASETDSGQRSKIEELIRRLTEEQKKAAAAVSDLLGRIITDENACVEVLGEIAPGTLIEICQIALFVSEPLRKVRVRLDKAGGKVVPEPL
ncbi:MAG: FapA family protein [Treponema sp.]|nr:FapA family protein [Treponema sp.]